MDKIYDFSYIFVNKTYYFPSISKPTKHYVTILMNIFMWTLILVYMFWSLFSGAIYSLLIGLVLALISGYVLFLLKVTSKRYRLLLFFICALVSEAILFS